MWTCKVGCCSQCCHADATDCQRNCQKKFSSGPVDNQGRDAAAKHLDDPQDDRGVVGADGKASSLMKIEKKYQLGQFEWNDIN